MMTLNFKENNVEYNNVSSGVKLLKTREEKKQDNVMLDKLQDQYLHNS